MQVHHYDSARYDFEGIIAEYLGTDDLAMLTSTDPGATRNAEWSLYKNMEHTPAYRRLYAALNGTDGRVFYETYRNFIAGVVFPIFGEAIYYQAKPTHRILYYDTPGQARYHRDSDYGHSPAEINFSVPQTPMYGNNAIWIESAVGKGDLRPMEAQVGQFVQFDGANLLHGARVNDTGATRVSFDFRVVPVSAADALRRSAPEVAVNDQQAQLFKNAHQFELYHP